VNLKTGLEAEENVFRKQSNDNSSALRVSYRVAHVRREPFWWEIRKETFASRCARDF
jgi:hypothetical protein